MPQVWKQQTVEYVRAILVVALSTGIRLALDPWLQKHSPLTTYFAGIMYVAWVSGWGPSILTIALSTLAGSYLFCEPRGSLFASGIGPQIQLVLFNAVGIYMTWLSNSLRRDIARRKVVEADLRRSEEQVRHHQAELAHVARLSSMGELAAGLAHELNQPLYAVTNYARGCQRRFQKLGSGDAELDEALGKIANEAQRAAAIVQRMRNFVLKREAQVSEEPVAKLIEDAVAMSQSKIACTHVAVSSDIAPNLPRVTVDAIQIQQVLFNLLRNAFDAMGHLHDDQRSVTIKARRCKNAVEVAVSDCGHGIPSNKLPQIFEPFFTTKSDGMGMGLAICRTIVQAHGGRIWAEPNADRGVCFHFTLPTTEHSNHD